MPSASNPKLREGGVHLKKIIIHGNRFPIEGCYPFDLEIFHKTKELLFTNPLTFFIGENGTGKSTLLKAVAQKCTIHILRDEEGYQRRVFYQNPYAEELYQYIEVEWLTGAVPGSYFDSEIFRYLAECIDAWAKPSPKLFEYFGGDSLSQKKLDNACNYNKILTKIDIQNLFGEAAMSGVTIQKSEDNSC